LAALGAEPRTSGAGSSRRLAQQQQRRRRQQQQQQQGANSWQPQRDLTWLLVLAEVSHCAG